MEPSILMNLTRSRILHMLAIHGPCSAADIASALGLSSKVALRELTLLADCGIVNRITASHGRDDPNFTAILPEIFQEMAHACQNMGLEI